MTPVHRSWYVFFQGMFVGSLISCELVHIYVGTAPKPMPSTHGDVAASVVERGTSRVRYIGPADEDLGSCVCALEIGGEKASDGVTRTVCACTGKAWEGK